jgi:hypothetical protein
LISAIIRLLGVLGVGMAAGYFLARRGGKGRTLPGRTSQELRDAITHIAYEFVGLERALAAFQKPRDQGGERAFDLEAALVHARNLAEFFWALSRRRPAHRDGVYAAHYLAASASWAAIRHGLPQLPNERYDAVSKQLAHISIARSNKGARDFEAEIPRIAATLTAVWDRWRTELQDPHWSTLLDAELTHWRRQP